MRKIRRDIYNKVTELRDESNKWFNKALVFIVLLALSPPLLCWLCTALSVVLVVTLSLGMFACIFRCVLLEHKADELADKVISMLEEEAKDADT